MKRVLFASAVVLVFVFAGCSKSQPSQSPAKDQPRDGGAERRRPALDQISASILKDCPDYLMMTVMEHSFTPMKELLGTTLPDGSWLVTVKIQTKPKEPLFTSFAPAIESAPKGAKANADTLNEMQVLAQWCSSNPFTDKMQARRGLLPIAIEVAGPSDVHEGWMKVIAEPRGQDWNFDVIEGSANSGFSNSLPANRLSPKLLKFDSAEQRQNLEMVRQDYTAWKRRQEVTARIAPEIDRIRAGETELAQKYYNDAQIRLDALGTEFRAKFSALEAQRDKWFRSMSNDSSQWAERDRLTSEATAAFEQWRATWEPKRAACEAEMEGSKKRAKDDTNKMIADLYRKEGVEL
jgi:hypothetical protein